jgi:hypothetical protein
MSEKVTLFVNIRAARQTFPDLGLVMENAYPIHKLNLICHKVFPSLAVSLIGCKNAT